LLPLLIASLMITMPPVATSAITAMRMRPLSTISRSVVNEAVRRSPTIQRLLAELQRLDVLVFFDLNPAPVTDLGTTSVMAAAGGFRMVRVLINANLDPRRRIEVLGHELQHVFEIAQERSVVDDASLRSLYSRIGYQVGLKSFETDQARQVELQVRRELAMPTK
jgi:hypothetical protein